MIKIESLYKSFGKHVVLDNVSINIEHSSIVGLAGPSGGGKSTLLRCIQKLESIDSGSIEFKGKSGFMFQDFQLFPHMSVMKNLTYSPSINNKKEDYNSKAKSILKQLGLEQKSNEYPKKLSGGQKQRVALARCLMMNPEVLLCDEPTSGLDVATTLDVVNLLKSIRDMNVTMVIASHDLDFLTKISDRIILLKDGKITLDIEVEKIDNTIEYLKSSY